MLGQVIALDQRRVQAPTDGDLERFVAIHKKRAEGQELSEEEKASLGRVAGMVVDSIDIPSNEALRGILKRFLSDGEISEKQQAKLHEALGEIPHLPKNPELEGHLRSLRAKGFATEDDIERIPQLTGKMSVQEDEAIFAALMSLAVAKGISPEGAEKIQVWMERQRVDASKFSNKQSFWGQAKRLGLVALTAVGLGAAFTFAAPVAIPVLGAIGAQLAGAGVGIGTILAVSHFGGPVASRSNERRVQEYGVND